MSGFPGLLDEMGAEIHTPSNGSWHTCAYMHAAEFWNERVEMMQVWADHLDRLRHGSLVDQSVRPLTRSQG